MATFYRGLSLAALLVAVTLLSTTGSCQALAVENKRNCSVEVFVPPIDICEPCKCPPVQCIRAPCEQPTCICFDLCKPVPGVVIKSNATVTLIMEKTTMFPLSYLNAVIGGVVYVVNKSDLKEIGILATVVVTDQSCGKGQVGIEALVYPTPKSYGSLRICLLSGERYGT